MKELLHIKKMELAYHPDQILLEIDEIRAGEGEIISIIGRNGSGKSTLLKTIAGFQKIYSGSCMLAGKELADYSARKRAHLISFVSANAPYLPSLTVWDLVSLGRIPYTDWTGKLSKHDREVCKEVIRDVGLESFSHRQVFSLSDGERQRAMIARALVQDTPLVLLDEPTAFLDIPNTFELIRIFKAFRKKGRILVYTTHDFDLAMEHADQLWVLKGGKLTAGSPLNLVREGVFDDLFSNSGLKFDRDSLRFRLDSA